MSYESLMNALIPGNLPEYTEHITLSMVGFSVMCIYFRLTSIATLLIGLQLFSLKLVDAKMELGLTNNHSLNQSLISSNSHSSERLNTIPGTISDFQPQVIGGPDYTRGSGTR
jgi:hypothetical protein